MGRKWKEYCKGCVHHIDLEPNGDADACKLKKEIDAINPLCEFKEMNLERAIADWRLKNVSEILQG